MTLDFASHFDRPDGSIDLRERPDGFHLSPSAGEAGGARMARRRALRRPTPTASASWVSNVGGIAEVRVLVTGDSTSLAIAAGLGDHGRVHGDVVVDWAGQVGCPLTHAKVMRFPDGHRELVGGCNDFSKLWDEQLRSFRPDVVLVVSSLTDVSDLDFGDGWQHIGQRSYDDRYRAAMTNAIGEFRKFGVTVLWASAPREQLGSVAATAVLDSRLRALNAIIASVTANRTGVRELPFAAHIDRADGSVDMNARPDGVHFTVSAATRIADQWLAAALVAAAHHQS